MTAKPKNEAISNLLQWQEEQQEKFERRKEALIKKLTKLVPRNLRKWIKLNHHVLPELFEYCYSESVIFSRDVDKKDYGFKDLEEFRTRFSNLISAWEGVINITTSGVREHSIELVFTAI